MTIEDRPLSYRARSTVAWRWVVGLAGMAAVVVLLVLSVPGTPLPVAAPQASSTASPSTTNEPSYPIAIASKDATAPPATGSHYQPKPACTPWPSLPTLEDAGLPTGTPRFSSDRAVETDYWRNVSHFGRAGQTYSDVDDIASDSDLVIVGHLVGTQLGRVAPFSVPSGMDEPRLELFGVVAIDQVIKGKPADSGTGTVLVAGLGPEDSLDMPSGQFLIFLQNYADLREAYGVAPSCDPADAFLYARPNGYQAVVLIHDGRLSVIDGPKGWKEALGPFPSELEGTGLADVITRIHEGEVDP